MKPSSYLKVTVNVSLIITRRQQMVKEKHLVPTLSETWLWRMSVGGFLRRVEGQTHSHELVPPGCQRDSAGQLRYAARFGHGKMVFTSGSPLDNTNLVSLGRWWHARGKWYCRETLCSAQAKRGLLYCVSKHQILRGLRESRSSTDKGGFEPLCAGIKGASNREMISGNGLFCSRNKEKLTCMMLGAIFKDA